MKERVIFPIKASNEIAPIKADKNKICIYLYDGALALRQAGLVQSTFDHNYCLCVHLNIF